MAKKTTDYNRLAFQLNARKHEVLELMGWGELYFEQWQLRCALHFLLIMTRENEERTTEICGDPAFGGWWKRHWYDRDEQFLAMAEEGKWPLQVRRFRYRGMHDASELATGKTQDGQRLKESYERDLLPMLR